MLAITKKEYLDYTIQTEARFNEKIKEKEEVEARIQQEELKSSVKNKIEDEKAKKEFLRIKFESLSTLHTPEKETFRSEARFLPNDREGQ